MRIWFDALTPKQARIAAVLAEEGVKRGFDVFITCRCYDYVEEVLTLMGVKDYICLEGHGETKEEKLEKGISRMRLLLRTLSDRKIDIHISLTSPEGVRIAFGLGIPIVALTDTPHAYHVNKLTLPLANIVMAPKAIPIDEWLRYIPHGERDKIKTFDGIFEVMWVKRFKPSGQSLKRLGLERPFIVLRLEESKAAYYGFGDMTDLTFKIIEEALRRGYAAVVFPRYEHQEIMLRKAFSHEIERGFVIIPKGLFIDGLDLAWHASLVITGGSTMSHEAALLGTPALSYFPRHYHTDSYLRERGFPLYRCFDKVECLNIVRALLEKGEKANTLDLLKSIEDPTDRIFELALRLLQSAQA